MTSIVISPIATAGLLPRIWASLRTVFSRRLLLQLVGVKTIVLEGTVCAVRPVPLGVARLLVPALLRASRKFADWKIDEEVYDDLVIVLSLGLRLPAQRIEQLTVPLWELSPVIEAIAVANGMPLMEAGKTDMGKLLAMMTSTPVDGGTTSMPTVSRTQAGHGITSIPP